MDRLTAFGILWVLGVESFSAVLSGSDENSLDGDADVSGSDALDNYPLIDGHNDLAYNLNRFLKNQITDFDFESDVGKQVAFSKCDMCHTDLQKLRKGRLSAQFWAAYISCNNPGNPVSNTLEQIDVIKRLIRKYPNDLVFATSSDDIAAAFKEKKIASFIGVEGGHSIDNKLSVLRAYYDLGVRYLTLTHTCDLRWADSATVDIKGSPKNNLSDFGRKIVLEMNRLGMLVDLSHVSKNVMLDTLKISRAPVIFSHSSARKIYDHVRNVDDDVLVKLAENDGIIMVNFYTDFVGPNATIRNVAYHINHIVDVIGVNHVGIGADFDGVPSTPQGLENTSKYPQLFDVLRQLDPNRWTIGNLELLAGRNFVRVFRKAEQVRENLSGVPPAEDILDEIFYHMI
ncbi:uncharacterized protein LOC132698482 isoform X2 [Cylas formicarius]|uniref:uncharacterized protein LOC132698482 isoform X2 n=1 Tax=Cylas formicarius TaxID=197179 RepID=UPI002958D75F|nr:uncharacterized protein LOC132698482 isoform X2 [Cylas formicarius]